MRGSSVVRAGVWLDVAFAVILKSFRICPLALHLPLSDAFSHEAELRDCAEDLALQCACGVREGFCCGVRIANEI